MNDIERYIKQRTLQDNNFAEGFEEGFNNFLAEAKKLATLSPIEYLEKRAERGSREKFLAILDKAPDVEPDEFDRI